MGINLNIVEYKEFRISFRNFYNQSINLNIVEYKGFYFINTFSNIF